MLSPASLRVCCLAVMAPALTKADRQADCLPVVLSESFCVSKTPHSLNGEDKVNEIRFKCAYSSEYVQNKRKPFMHRACWRTQKSGPGFLNKYRSLSIDSPKSLLCSGRVRTQRDAKHKSWQSTNAATAYAGKIKLKYTMNKNISNIKNMGLAKANTSLGLQSLKKVKQFSKENQNSVPNVMEDSLNFSDSQDSTVQLGSLISDIGVLTANSDSDVLPMDTDATPCVNNNGRTSPEDAPIAISGAADAQCSSESVLENVSQSLLTSASANLMEPMDTSNTSVTLTDLLCSAVKSTESGRNSPSNSVSSLTCDFPTSNLVDADCETAGIPNSTMTLQSPVNDSSFEVLPRSESDVPSETSIDIPVQPLVSKEVSSVMFSKFRDLKLPILNSNYSGTPFMASSLFSALTCSKLVMNASKLSSKEPLCPVLTDCRFGLQFSAPVRKEKNVCCLPMSQELESLELMLAEKSVSINSVLSRSTLLLRKQMNAHSKKQISSLVEHYQRKYQIPCQRPTKHVNIKSGKDLVDLKAELLQSEDVKNMSTAALVSLVRKLESSGSQARILSPKILSSSSEVIESMPLNFEPDECDDIKHTSDLMLSNLKSLMKLSDPYFTDSSEDECSSETEDEETESDIATDNRQALWKYLTERAALASSSTWLLARNHELEYRIKEYDDRWSEIVKAEGKVCLEEHAASQNSESAGSDNTCSQASIKEHAVKSFLLPLNGFLDPSDASHIAKTTISESFLPELESSKRTDFNVEVKGSCCRTKPLDTGAFRKRKLAFIPGLHATNPKFSRLSSVNCYCNSQSELASCILCTGQYNSTQSIDPHSMVLRDRIAILDPYFHPVLSSEKDIPVCLQLENYFKIEAKYRNIQPVSLDPNSSMESEEMPAVKPKLSDIRSHRKLSRYARSLSAKYRKHHRNSRHLRKHKLVFGKWRRLHSKRTLDARTRFRRHSVISSGSSPDSPVLSPMSVLDDGFEKRRRDENQFDIDDVIIPCNSRSGRLVEIQYKEIMIPSWRSVEDEILLLESCETEDSENITDSFLTKRHDMLEVEEKEKMKRAALGLNRRRRNRCDSRADSSGANTPDPTTLYNNQENVFQIPNFTAAGDPASPASPPATPNSAVISDDSQSAFGNGSMIRPEKRKTLIKKQPVEESVNIRTFAEFEEVLPFESLQFPLPDGVYEELLAEADHDKEEYDIPSYSPNYPASPISSSSSTSTVEEDEDDVTDPEWTVVKTMRNGPDQALVLKFAKR